MKLASENYGNVWHYYANDIINTMKNNILTTNIIYYQYGFRSVLWFWMPGWFSSNIS